MNNYKILVLGLIFFVKTNFECLLTINSTDFHHDVVLNIHKF